MKKLFATTLILVLAFSCFATGLDYIQHGEYAVYSDKRGPSPFLRAYWFGKVEDGGHYVVLSVNRNLKTGQQVNFFMECRDGDDGLPQVLKVDGLGDKTPPEFAQGLADFMNYTTLYIKHREEIGFDSLVEDPWDDYTLEFSFNRLLPFFRFLDIKVQGQDEAAYVLDSSGIIQVADLKKLVSIGFAKLAPRERGLGDLGIAPAAPMRVTMNGLSTILDERWVYNDGLGSPGYWFPLRSVRDSQVTVEKLPEPGSPGGDLSAEEVCRLCILTTPNVDFRSVLVTQADSGLHVAYTTYDENGVKNYQFFIVRQLGASRLAINFSTFADIFDQNPEYYEKIMAGLEGN